MCASPAFNGSSGKLSASGFNCMRHIGETGYGPMVPAELLAHSVQYQAPGNVDEAPPPGSTMPAARNCGATDVPAGISVRGGSKSYENVGSTFCGRLIAPLTASVKYGPSRESAKPFGTRCGL